MMRVSAGLSLGAPTLATFRSLFLTVTLILISPVSARTVHDLRTASAGA